MFTYRFDLCTDDSSLFFVKLAGDRRTNFRVILYGQVEIEIYQLRGHLHVRDCLFPRHDGLYVPRTPVIKPFGSKSISQALGFDGRPGKVMMSPAYAITC